MTYRVLLVLGVAALGTACAVGTDPVMGFSPAPRLDGGLEEEDTDGETDGESDGETEGGAEGDADSGGLPPGDDPPQEDEGSTGEPPPGDDGGEAEPPVDPACLPQPTDGACRACAREHCCSELQGCEGDANCSCALDCLETGTEPEICYEQCGDSLPALVLAVCGVEPCGTCF